MIDNGNDPILRQDLGDMAFQDSAQVAVGKLVANQIIVPSLTYTTSVGTNSTTTNLVATNGTVTTLNGTTGTYTNFTVSNLVATSATTTNATTTTLVATNLTATNLVNNSGVSAVFSSTTQTLSNKTFDNTNTWNGVAISGTVGGTGATSLGQGFANLIQAVASTGSAGQALHTSGGSNYYWATPAGGGGGAQGQTITTARSTVTASASQITFSSIPAFTVGAGQLRVYINGVRQHPDAYTEVAGGTSITFSEALTAGMVVLFEVDSYMNYTISASSVVTTSFGPYGASNVQTILASINSNKLDATATAVAASSVTSDATVSGTTAKVGYRGVPQVSYTGATITVTDAHSGQKFVATNITGEVTVTSGMAADCTVSFINMTAGNLTIRSNNVNMYIAGSGLKGGNGTAINITAWGVSTATFINGTGWIFSGIGVS